MPEYAHLSYLASLLKIRNRPRSSQKFMELLLRRLEPMVTEWQAAMEPDSGCFEPYIEPDLLLFYADYGTK